MNNNSDPRGTMVRCGRGMCINNAKVEEVSTRNGRTGFILVSYATPGPNNLTMIEMLRLNINRGTSLVDRAGRPVSLNSIRPGMWVDAEFSSALTRSIPPQANAFRVVVRQQRPQPTPPQPPQPPRPQPPRPQPPRPQPPQPPQPQPPSQNTVTTANVVSVDTRSNTLTTGVRNNINRQMVFTVSSGTRIVDRRGRPIRLVDIRPGQRVRVTHANFQTMSIPPQSPAYIIQQL